MLPFQATLMQCVTSCNSKLTNYMVWIQYTTIYSTLWMLVTQLQVRTGKTVNTGQSQVLLKLDLGSSRQYLLQDLHLIALHYCMDQVSMAIYTIRLSGPFIQYLTDKNGPAFLSFSCSLVSKRYNRFIIFKWDGGQKN